MNRTVRIRLRPTPEQAAALHETMRQFTASFNAVCRVGWEQRRGNAYTLHRLTYYDCRAAFPQLSSNLHVQAREKAAEAVRSALARARKDRKVSCPQSALCPPRYNCRTFLLNWEASTVSLSTTAGRVVLPFHLPKYAAYAIGLPVATADLIFRKGTFYLHVVVDLPPVEVPDTGPTIGVDLGVNRPAVTSDNRFHGKRHWREVVKRTFRLRRALQANGSKSAKRHLRRLAGREQRFRRDCDHVLSKSILHGLPAGTTIVVENLTHIRAGAKCRKGEGKRRLHAWSFRQLRAFLQYKAEARGCRVVAIDPHYTSQRCHTCGYIERANRKSQSEFCCRKCGHRENADLNGAKNVRDKHLVGWAICLSGGPSSTGLSSRISLPWNGGCFGPGTS
jgi:IS605 OrfB family transposase